MEKILLNLMKTGFIWVVNGSSFYFSVFFQGTPFFSVALIQFLEKIIQEQR